MKNMNALLLESIKSRKQTASEFNSGILTADRYVKTLQDCVGHDLCYRYGSTKSASFNDVIKRAEGVLTYNNPEMVVVDIYSDAKAKFEDDNDIELPKNTLMVFEHVLTTSKKDRDGDILRTEGARVDPKMLLLWQHVHTLPIGKMLKVLEHNHKTLRVLSAIVDMNELSHDSAVMIENKMGRFSHGFRALSFTDLKESEGSTTGASGFDVKEFEVMEESLVSVPANPDAEQQEILLSLVEGDKLSSSIMKSYGKQIRDKQTKTTSAGGFDEREKSKCGCGKAEGKSATDLPSVEKDADDPKETEDSKNAEVMCPKCKIACVDGKCSECGYLVDEVDLGKEDKNKDVPSEKSVLGQKRLYGDLPGSWEDTQDQLRQICSSFCREKGLLPAEDSDGYAYAYLGATYPSKAILCVESKSGTKKYQSDWGYNSSGDAEFTGIPKEVMVRLSAQILEKSKALSQEFTKSGRTLSKTTLEKIKEVDANLVEIHEHCSTQTGKKLCKKTSETVKTMITQAEAALPPEGELKPTPGGEGLLSMQAAAQFLAKSTESERSHMLKVLSAQCSIDNVSKTTTSIRKAFVGNSRKKF